MLTKEQKELAIKFVKKSFLPSKTSLKDPYIIKHDFEFLTNIYMAETEMIEILSELGFAKSKEIRFPQNFYLKGTPFYRKLRYVRFYANKDVKIKYENLVKDFEHE